MKKLFRPFSLACALLMLLAALAGCSNNGNNGHSDSSAQPTGLPTAPIADTPDPNADPTEVPEWMWTPDPAKYALGPDGYFEDDYITAYWPAYLQFGASSLDNSVFYYGYPEGSENRLTFSYTWDLGASYADEVAGFDFNSYQEYLTNGMNLYYFLEEMNYVKVDGHDALRAIFNYNPPGEPEHFVRILQYAINVNGWVLGLGFSTKADTFPEEVVDSIATIKFKPGY